MPSLAKYVNESVPKKLGFGVYVNDTVRIQVERAVGGAVQVAATATVKGFAVGVCVIAEDAGRHDGQGPSSFTV